jgi:membrane protein
MNVNLFKKTKAAGKTTLQYIVITLPFFFKNSLFNHTAACAYGFLLSVTPMLLLICFFMLRTFNISSQTIITLLKNIPSLDVVVDEQWIINNFSTFSGPGGFSGFITILSIFWAGRLLAVSLHRGIKIIFTGSKKRNPLADNLIIFAIEFVALVLSFVLIISSQAALYLYDIFDFLPETSLLSLATSKYGRGIFLTIMLWFASFCSYRFIPTNPPRLISAIWGSIIYIFAYECMSMMLGFLFEQSRMNFLYGALGNLIMMLINVYFFFLFFFAGAQLAFVSDALDALLFVRMRRSRAAKKRRRYRFLFSDVAKKLFFKVDGRLKKYQRFYRRGEIIFSQEDKGEEIFYILEGEAEVLITSLNSDYRAETLGAGSFFGEMSYLLSEGRSATIRAKTDISTLSLPPRVFEEILKYDTGLNKTLIEHLTRRIKKGNDQIAALSATVNGKAMNNEQLTMNNDKKR